MIYNGTINIERIVVHPMNDTNNHQIVELTKYSDEPTFSVDLYDGEYNWYWEFDLTNPSDYERVKYCILDAVFVCDIMRELAESLDDIFTDEFADILIEEDECAECNCCMCCGNC